VVGFTGRSGGGLLPLCDRCLCIPADRTARIQEMHLLLGHAICGVVESALMLDWSAVDGPTAE
jgi:D-sedoheptulose 7-phosphate isomerase